MAKVYEIIDFQRRDKIWRPARLGRDRGLACKCRLGEPKNDFYRPDFSKKEYAWQSAGFDGVSVYDTAGMF